MKSKKQHYFTWILFIALCISMLFPLQETDTFQAATSYTNAKEFYESTGIDEDYHVEMINGTIYYATAGKKARSSSSLKYTSIGFDVKLSAGEHTLNFSVKTGKSLTQLQDARVETDTYIYQLYTISTENIYQLAMTRNATVAKQIFNNSTINVKINAIMTTSQNGKRNGSIEEDGSGGLNEDGTVYHLAKDSDLAAMRRIFSGHTFRSYINIESNMTNHQLNIRYAVNGTAKLNENSSSKATVNAGYRLVNYTENGITVPYVLYKNGTLYTSSARVFDSINLLNPEDIHLTKTGYHLIDGKEWIYDDRYFTHTSYMPKDIHYGVGYSDQNIYMYANWQANSYSVYYNANGGTGSVLPTDFTYDQTRNLSDNTFTRTGYKLKKGAEWNTKPDGTGTSYASGASVSNLSSENGGTVTLYANWEPEVYSITLDRQNGTGGTSVIYEKYGVGFFSDASCTKAITTITNPSKTAHLFQGYYASLLGAGRQIVNAHGILQIGSTYYTSNEIIYAHYIPNEYTITFDKQGGKLGTDSIKVYSGDYFPSANAPVRSGYTFKGYYTQTNGGGTQYYNENMASGKIFTFTSDLTLYACWADDTAPTVVLKTSADKWTNQTVTLTADASDFGRGLKSVSIYRVADNGTLSLVAQNASCNGAASVTLSYANPTEGIIRYKAVATDLAGNTAESYNIAYYDITPPKGEILNRSVSGTTAFFKVNITDVHIK